MSGVAEAFFQGARIETETGSVVEVVNSTLPRIVSPVYDEQVRLLVQRLFHPEEARYRCVAFSAADAQTDVAPLCLSIARTLSERGKHEVGLIDASSQSSLSKLHSGHPGVCSADTSDLENRIWMVQRQAWISGDSGSISDENITRLKDLTRQFDHSVLCCGPMSWLATRVGRICDGLVLILTANQTRRLVAQNIRDQLSAAQVRLLGTVLAARRFPIPTALYRKL